MLFRSGMSLLLLFQTIVNRFVSTAFVHQYPKSSLPLLTKQLSTTQHNIVHRANYQPIQTRASSPVCHVCIPTIVCHCSSGHRFVHGRELTPSVGRFCPQKMIRSLHLGTDGLPGWCSATKTPLNSFLPSVHNKALPR